MKRIIITILLAAGMAGCVPLPRELTEAEIAAMMAASDPATATVTERVTVTLAHNSGSFFVYLTTDNMTGCEYLSMVSGSGTNTELVPDTCKLRDQ